MFNSGVRGNLTLTDNYRGRWLVLCSRRAAPRRRRRFFPKK